MVGPSKLLYVVLLTVSQDHFGFLIFASFCIVDDLPSLDPELYQSLMFLKNYPGDVEKDLMLTFAKDENGSSCG